MTVRKAVILAAGHGTRFLPATKAVPKEMLPLVDQPVIQYVVEEAVAAGLHYITIVTAGTKRSVEDHFDRNFDLEQVLESSGREAELREVRRLAHLAEITFVRQKERRGIAHAVLTARHVVGDDPFALFFPDDIIVSDVPAIRQLIDVYEKHEGSVIAVQRLPREEVVHYGVITPEPVEDRVYRVRGIVEKPSVEEAPSDLTTVGRYVLTADIWPLLEQTQPGASGEMQLTDTLAMLLQAGHPLFACEFQGERFDTGRPLGLLEASVALALRREDTGPALKRYLRSLSLS
ncbi:MAG: UTP--glucose-1-phosphate uridylyltransferase GalU [Chloroflexi bacterium]|nr:UTP--glucose-1-phosphate uridylyltransferase GalU [Chloroflexota bacterium]